MVQDTSSQVVKATQDDISRCPHDTAKKWLYVCGIACELLAFAAAPYELAAIFSSMTAYDVCVQSTEDRYSFVSMTSGLDLVAQRCWCPPEFSSCIDHMHHKYCCNMPVKGLQDEMLPGVLMCAPLIDGQPVQL